MPSPPNPYRDSSDLPRELAIFPLQGVLLLPGGQLPLNIFEPRYLAMTEDAMGGAGMIGMIQPREAERQDPSDHPDVYATGCAGRISDFTETADGRYEIVLTGVCRFDVAGELPLHRGYRRVAANYAPYSCDLGSEIASGVDRSDLLAALRGYLERRSLSADWDTIQRVATDDLVSALSMSCPFAPSEKQALLESPDTAGRGDLIISLMKMDSLSGPDDASRFGSGAPH